MRVPLFSSLRRPALIATRGIDGVLTSGAVLRLLDADPATVPLLVCNGGDSVDCVDLAPLPPASEVVIVDLAFVQKKTVEFLKHLRDAGHTLRAILSASRRAPWLEACAEVGVRPDALLVLPEDYDLNRWPSSGRVLKEALFAKAREEFARDPGGLLPNADFYASVFELVGAVDSVLQDFHYNHPLARLVYEATCSSFFDLTRPVHIARALAAGTHAVDPVIAAWQAESRAIPR